MREFARKSDMRLEKVQVNEVMERAYEIFSQQLKLRQIEVVWEIQKNLPVIMADAGRLEQVVINLLVNARDGIEARWTKEASAVPPGKKIFLRTALKGKKVVVEVEDTGTGIPPGIQEKIFEPFFTTKAVGKGTGLGLSISYGIVKDFQGDIRYSNAADGGACFHLEFPIHQLTQETGHGKK
jgi:histidine kinase